MNKMIAFKVNVEKDKNLKIAETVLATGYPVGDVCYKEDPDDSWTMVIQFMVNRFDLNDLRHDAEVLKMAGIDVQEVKPL